MDTLLGIIERITFRSPENGFTVAKLKPQGKADLVCVVGNMPTIQPGETVECTGTWKRNPAHGMQFEAMSYETRAPADLTGIKKYLGSGLIKGIGPKYAEKIVAEFGKETLKIIEDSPDRLNEIKGIGKKRIGIISQCWIDQKHIREVMIFLQQHEISPTFAQKIYKTYGDRSIELLLDDPFRLARDIYGVGFKSADKVAMKLGMEKNSPKRVDAGIEYSLSELSNDGHTCYPADEFIELSAILLDVSMGNIRERIEAQAKEERISVESILEIPHIWLRPLYLSERGIARELIRLQSTPSPLRKIDTKKALEWVQEILHIDLAENQGKAVEQALVEKVQIITGGPGTGKSTITKAILAISEKLTRDILLAAPTGRAAKRMTEITHKEAKTIHSLLEFDFNIMGFKRNRQNPLKCDLIIVDESSMIDTSLMYSLLKALPDHARVIFVGDINQLPSVGPGNVLRDIIDSQKLPVSMLTEIFRQARGSRIITNAHRINQGEFPNLKIKANSDFFFIEAAEYEQVIHEIRTLVTGRLKKKYGYDSFDQIQVLSPMKRGEIGTENLNFLLQQALNPSTHPLIWAGKQFHEKDKVMQLKNNYKKEVYNGDIGRIVEIDTVMQQMMVDFDGKIVEYDFSDLDELVLAYAVSVHKYQGSECQCIIMPIHTAHFKLLHRNLLYTGVTRGKKLVILIGTMKAIGMAVKNDEVKKRHTGLKYFCEKMIRST